MESQQHQTEELQKQEQNSPEDGSSLSAENIEERISAELEKVVGIDEDLLRTYIEFLGNMKTEAVEALLKRLKERLEERVLPLLELMARHEQKTIAELGINGLGSVQSFKAAQILAEIDETHPDKKLRKAARRSLYRLKSVGIEVETSHKPLLGALKHEPYKALISPVDGMGSQLILLSEEMLAGDLHLLQVIANETEGIKECLSRRGFSKRMLERLPESFARETGGMSLMIVETEYDYAKSLVLEAEALTDEAGGELPPEYVAMKTFFGLTQAQVVENPIYKTYDAENLKTQVYFLRTAEELFQNDFFLGWLLPINEIGSYAQEILDQEDTVLELSPQFQQERKEEVYQKVIDEYLDADAIKRLQRRLEIMAYIFSQQEQEENAKRALTAALAFEEMSNIALRTHPFLRRLILDSLTVAQYVIEDGYDPNDLDRESYVVVRNKAGELAVEIIPKQ